MGAVVFCQPIEMRVARAAGFCMAAVNCWNFCPDYEGVDLASCRHAHQEWACKTMPRAHELPHVCPLVYRCDVRAVRVTDGCLPYVVGHNAQRT